MRRIIYNVFGYKGSGKDTVCKMIAESYSKRGVEVDKLSFANPLKEIVREHFGGYMDDEVEQVWGSIEDKEKTIGGLPVRDEIKEIYPFLKDHDYWSGRLLLQFLGTEVFRGIDDKFWVNTFTAKVLKGEGHVAVSDCRFKNEYEAIEDLALKGIYNLDVVNIKINRKGYERDGHASEQDMRNFGFMYDIENNGPLDVLEKQVMRILDEVHE